MKFELKCVRSDGKTLPLTGDGWRATELDNFDKPTLEVFTEKNAVGSGDVITGQRVGARLVTVKAKNNRPALNAQMRKITAAFFSPRFTYDLVVTMDDVARRAAACKLKAISMPIDNLYGRQELTVSLLCPGGYLNGENNFGQNLAAVTGGFGFPFVSAIDYGYPFSVYNFAKSVEINNDGDAPTYCRAVMRARGDVTNPKLAIGGAYVRLLTTMKDGDALMIDTEARAVDLNGDNAVRLLDKGSNFADMRINVGSNTISFDADYGDNALDVMLYYDKNYLSL